MNSLKKDKDQLAPISKERLEKSLEKARKIEHVIDDLVQKFVTIYAKCEKSPTFEFFSTLRRFEKIFNVCLTEICNDLDLLGITFHNISLRRIYQFGKISCTSFLKKTLVFYENQLNNKSVEAIQEQEMKRIKFFEEQLGEFVEYLKETKKLTKKTNGKDQIFENQTKIIDRYEKMEKLRFLIEQEGYEIDQLINKIKGGENEIDDLLFKSRQNLIKINESGAAEILESIHFKSFFDKNNLDFIALLKIAEKKSEQFNNQGQTSKKFIEDITKSILKTIKKTQNRKKNREGKLVSMEEIDFPQQKATQVNYEDIAKGENQSEKNGNSPETINGLNTYIDAVLRKANLIEIQKKSLEKEKIEYDLKLKEKDFRLKEGLNKIYKKKMKIKELKKNIADLKEKLSQFTYSDINLQNKLKEKEESISRIKILLQKKVEQSASDLQDFNKTVKFFEKQVQDANSKLEELNLKRIPSVQFIEKKNIIQEFGIDEHSLTSRGFNLDTAASPTRRFLNRKNSNLMINHHFSNDTNPSSSKLKRGSTINQFTNLKEMPKSSGKKLSNFGDQHKILVRRSKTSNFLALKEEEIEKFSETSLDSKSEVSHISEESKNSLNHILKHDTENNRLDTSKSISITSEKNECQTLLEDGKGKGEIINERKIKVNKSQTFHSSKSNVTSVSRKEDKQLNECIEKIKRFEKGYLLLTINFLEKILHIHDKKLFFLKIDNFLMKYDQINQFTQTEGRELVSKSIQIDLFKENEEIRPKTGVILKVKSMSQHQITPIRSEPIIQKIELEKLTKMPKNKILLSLSTPKPADIDQIKPTSRNYLYNKTFETTPNVNIKNKKNFSLFFKNFDQMETLQEEKKLENFLINLTRKKSSSIQISSEKETTKITSNNDLTKSLSSFKYPFKKLNNEMDKEGMEQLNSLIEELYKKHRKCGKFCEHMRRFFQRINLLGFGGKKILAIHNKYIDKLPPTFY